jgi:hypothetical protein
MTSRSQVAALLAHIENEYVAGRRAIHESSCGSSRHQFLSAKMERMSQLHVQFGEIVGDPMAAMELIAEQLQDVHE